LRRYAYIARRVALLVFVLFGISLVTFFLARVVPSDPAALYVGPHARPEQIQRARVELGLDKPLSTQYARYMGGLLRGDWGTSIRTHRPVLEDVKRFLPASLELVVTAIAFAAVVGIPLGAVSARYKGSVLDHGARLVSIAGVSLPSFWLALLLQIVFFRALGLLPAGGRLSVAVEQASPVHVATGFYLLDTLLSGNWPAFFSAVEHIVLPAITLAAYPLGLFTRMTRSSMVDALGQDFVRAAQAHGIPSREITFVYALKNALGPTLTVLGLIFAYCLTGAFFVELIFSWPGLGTYAVKSILSTDYPAIMAVTLVVASFYVTVNLVVDLIHASIDPRIVLR